MTDPAFYAMHRRLEILWAARHTDDRWSALVRLLLEWIPENESDRHEEHGRMVMWFKELSGEFEEQRLNVIDITDRIRQRRAGK